MRIETITIRGFRCFDDTGQTMSLDGMTCLVGPNAAGKTAMMAALARMFGETQHERSIQASDFHLSPGDTLAGKDKRCLSVEVRLVFPELEEVQDEDHDEAAENDHDAQAIGAAVPESFNQMIVDAPETTPYCRVRLEAVWHNDGTPSGEVQQWLWWILTASADPEVERDHRRHLKPAERARVRVVYVPATRDPTHQIRGATSTVFGRLLRALDWAGKDEEVRERLVALNTELGRLAGIGTINAQVQAVWNRFYNGRIAANVAFGRIEAEPAALLRMLVPTFVPGEQGQHFQSEDLSDGLRSLFALALPLGLFNVEEQLKAATQDSGFVDSVAEALPLLTVFALEEPENHLSPHYLGRVVRQLSAVATAPTAQVVMSSHSPSIMARVEPDQVRYFLGGEARPVTKVLPLDLPDDSDGEAFKYVREAVRGFPELYFSRLVVLGEGPSEEIILRRVLEESGTPLDVHFISVVPLGGRHVNHFWRLLNGLDIPYVTLLDLDREKHGGGWARIQYIRDQLVALYAGDSSALEFVDTSGAAGSLASSDYDTLRDKCSRTDLEEMKVWLGRLRDTYDVFFSAPLDLDFAMLEAFPCIYKRQAPPGGGPRLPDREETVPAAIRQVLGTDSTATSPEIGSSYTDLQRRHFPWYKYLFLDGSKPVAHMRALVALDEPHWIKKIPESLKALVERVRQVLTEHEKEDDS